MVSLVPRPLPPPGSSGPANPAIGPAGQGAVALPAAAVDDAALVEGLAAGRPAAVALLFDRYRPEVRRILTRMLGSTRDVDDLAQEAFLVVLRRCKELRDPSALRSYVVSVAIRTARGELRKRALRQMLWSKQTLDPPVVPAHDPAVVQGMRALYAALDRLDAASRIVFILRHVEEYELAEAAQVVGCSLATLKRRLARAEKRFGAIAERDPVLQGFVGTHGGAQ